MEENEQLDPEKNQFLTRGCCHGPQIYQSNDGVFNHSCSKLDVYDWLKDIPMPDHFKPFDCIEVRFKNNRKDFYRLPADFICHVGDIVAVEASPGHDIGIVSLTGELDRGVRLDHVVERFGRRRRTGGDGPAECRDDALGDRQT